MGWGGEGGWQEGIDEIGRRGLMRLTWAFSSIAPAFTSLCTAVISLSCLPGTHMPTHTHNPNPALDTVVTHGKIPQSWASSAHEAHWDCGV